MAIQEEIIGVAKFFAFILPSFLLGCVIAYLTRNAKLSASRDVLLGITMGVVGGVLSTVIISRLFPFHDEMQMLITSVLVIFFNVLSGLISTLWSRSRLMKVVPASFESQESQQVASVRRPFHKRRNFILLIMVASSVIGLLYSILAAKQHFDLLAENNVEVPMIGWVLEVTYKTVKWLFMGGIISLIYYFVSKNYGSKG